ncbi:MAG: mechanosensitive ion channel family protein [Oscillospiraceae bacterium]|nr:mechanosensitive ion channel family protein [Oscillospiraceae bacterium]
METEILIRVAVIVIAAVAVLLFTRKYFSNIKRKANITAQYTARIVKVCILIAAAALIVLQIPALKTVITPILAGSGVLVLVVSLAAQESLSNIISGWFIVAFKTFEIGDRIHIMSTDIVGNITDITLRHTIVKTFTNTEVVVPNSVMNKSNIENFSLTDTKSSSFIDVSVAYEADIELAMSILGTIIGEHPQYCGNLPVNVFVRNLGESGVELRASMWTASIGENFEACSDTRYRILKEFARNGIEIPYNKLVTITHPQPHTTETK